MVVSIINKYKRKELSFEMPEDRPDPSNKK